MVYYTNLPGNAYISRPIFHPQKWVNNNRFHTMSIDKYTDQWTMLRSTGARLRSKVNIRLLIENLPSSSTSKLHLLSSLDDMNPKTYSSIDCNWRDSSFDLRFLFHSHLYSTLVSFSAYMLATMHLFLLSNENKVGNDHLKGSPPVDRSNQITIY